DDGDVEVPEPPREKEINRRALFHAANNTTEKDTLAPQTAYEATDKLSEGHASGNTDTGRDVGTPNAKLQGRKPVNGYLPKPAYRGQNSGTVVVNIKVDNYGKVISATVSTEGTTVTDKSLWQAALNAAKETRFNTTMDAPPSQEGTITYIFKVTK
ncbi:MAG: energy transducer TonB, partial [Bacteroidales bacterium]|nr:energy transducer TonB [Bacteroidales bacterium]